VFCYLARGFWDCLFTSRLGTLTPARISTKVGRPPKPAQIKPVSSKWKGTSQGSRPVSSKINALRDDENLAGAKSPSTATESSSSEEESTSEEESEYDEDEDMPKMDISEVRVYPLIAPWLS